jgi:PPP family 3-phenylpropionic acid transporter
MFALNAIIISFFPLYFKTKGYSNFQVGLIYSIGPMIGFAANLIWGILSDKWQTVKKIIIALFLGQLLVSILVFHVDPFLLTFILMGVFTFFQQPMISIYDSLIMLFVSENGKSYASFRVWGSVGFAASAAVFGFIIKKYGIAATPIVFLTMISITLLLALTLKDPKSRSGKKIAFDGLLNILKSKTFAFFLFFVMLLSIAHRLNDAFLALYLQELGAPNTIIGYSWMISAISEIPVFFLLSKYGHRFKELTLLGCASVLYAVRYLLLSSVHEPSWVLLIQVMHSVTFGIFFITAIRYLMGQIPNDYRASGQAIFAVVWSSAAGLIAGTLGGWIIDRYGGAVMYHWGVLFAVLAALGFFWMNYKESR